MIHDNFEKKNLFISNFANFNLEFVQLLIATFAYEVEK